MSNRHKFLLGFVLVVGVLLALPNFYRWHIQRKTEQSRTETGWVAAPGGYQQITRRDVLFALRSFSAQEFYWVDNDRVILPGFAVIRGEPDPKTGEAVYRRGDDQRGLYVWNVTQDKLTRVDDLGTHRPPGTYTFYELAYCDGVVHYTTPKSVEGDHDYRMGSIDALQDVPRDGRWKEIYERCKRIKPPDNVKPEHQVGHTIVRPLELGGYIYVGRCRDQYDCGMVSQEDREKPAIYIRPDGQAITLPLLAKQISSNWLERAGKYYAHAGKYFIVPQVPVARRPGDIASGWSDYLPRPIYLMSPAGEVTSVTVPAGYPTTGYFTLSRAGVLAITGTVGTDTSKAGGFLIRGDETIKLYDHVAEAYGVSPDGCRLAVAIHRYDGKTPTFPTVIDFCKKHQ